MASPRAEMLLLREALEGMVAPEVATSILYDALELAGRKPPRSLEETRAFAGSALADAVRRKLRPAEASEILKIVDDLFEHALESDGVAVEVELESEPAQFASNPQMLETAVMQVVSHPVPIVVLSADHGFAQRLEIVLGDDRAAVTTNHEIDAFRKSVFARTPLIVLVDSTNPPPIDHPTIVSALRGLPHVTMPVIWATETPWGSALRAQLESSRVGVLALERSEGIEPLLDLVLARFRGEV